MFALLTGFFQWLFSKTELQILIIGLDHAGKTTMLEQMKGLFQKSANRIPVDKIPPTVGLNIGRMEINNCRVIFWDLGGQVALRSIWDKYYSEAHGLIFVIDSADVDRFEEAKAAMEAIVDHPELAGVPLLVCANKQDLPTARSFEEIETFFQISNEGAARYALTLGDSVGAPSTSSANASSSSMGRRREKKLQPISALTCAGIETGIRWLVDCAVNNPDIARAKKPSS